MNLLEIENSLLDETTKGIPGGTPPFRLRDIREKRWNVLHEDMPSPIVTVKKSAIEHNREWMRHFLSESNTNHSPHGKTLVSPQIYENELRQGAWGITVATIHQLQVYRHFGAQRILYANQLVGRAGIQYVLDQLSQDPNFDFNCLVDSVEGVSGLINASRSAGINRPIQVLLEIGFEGGRAGCRSLESAFAVAEAIRVANPGVILCGFETYVGVIDEATIEATTSRIRGLLAFSAEIAEKCIDKGLVESRPAIFCAGCASHFDLVPLAVKSTSIAERVRIIIRSGSYLFFDSSWYANRFESTFERLGSTSGLTKRLEASVEVWGYVQSVPEPRRAILGIGRRETSFAFGMPVLLSYYRPDMGRYPQSLSNGHRIAALNDHHAFVDLPADSPLQYGDLVSVGISMPTATFDRWRLIFVVDDEYNVVGALKNFS
jgi:D-serine dehydratase